MCHPGVGGVSLRSTILFNFLTCKQKWNTCSKINSFKCLILYSIFLLISGSQENIVDVSWEDFRVNLYPQEIDKSTVYFEGEKQEDTDEKIVKRAWDIFNNDSFWLVAPHKLYDDGVVRNIEIVDKKEALRVTYTSGGSTPGDSYVWLLDSIYKPKSYKMYLKNGRMNGTSATWQDWITTKSGTLLPTNHTFENGGKLSMGEVKGYK